MKAFGQFLAEAATGNCMEMAGRAVMFIDLERDMPIIKKLRKDGATADSVRLVHAYVTGQGPLEGYRFAHAWVEHNNTCYDFANGNKIVMVRPVYHMFGQVAKRDPGQYRAYTTQEARRKAVGTGHWGPWDLDVKHEKLNSESKTMDEAKKFLPTRKPEIGKKKIRLSKDDKMMLKEAKQ